MVLTESNYETNRRGSIEVICGSMFSGKTEELIRRLKRAKIARQRVEIFKPAIDEAQFFDEGIVEVCSELANNGTRVIVAGLDMDFRRVPFGPMPSLLSIADDVYKVHAICVKCGHLANYSYRLVDNDKRVLLGEKNEYQPLCRRCYLQEMQAREDKEHSD